MPLSPGPALRYHRARLTAHCAPRCRDYARLQLADAVVATGYKRGQQILTQGKSDGVRFHIIERGQARRQAFSLLSTAL